MRIRLSKEQKIQIANTEHLYGVMRQILMRENMLARKQEHVWVVGLDEKAVIQLIELVALGSLNKVILTPTHIFRLLLTKGCSYFILVHNHPSGTLKPSKEDLDLSDKMQQIGAFQKLPLRDHLIITEAGYYSMADKGDLSKLWIHTKYPLHLIEKIDELEEAKSKAVRERDIEMAKRMKIAGVDEKIIAITTEMTVEEIRKLK